MKRNRKPATGPQPETGTGRQPGEPVRIPIRDSRTRAKKLEYKLSDTSMGSYAKIHTELGILERRMAVLETNMVSMANVVGCTVKLTW